MGANEKPIRLTTEEDGLLRKIYVQFRIPRDQYKRRPKDASAFISRWHKLSGRDDEMEQVVRYMKNQQKATARLQEPWPTFNGSHKRAPDSARELSKEQLVILRDIYEALVLPLGLGVDAVEADADLCSTIAKQFAKHAGLVVPAMELVSIAEDKRKRGEWCTVGGPGFSRGIGFTDMDQLDKVDERDGA